MASWAELPAAAARVASPCSSALYLREGVRNCSKSWREKQTLQITGVVIASEAVTVVNE